MAIPGDWAPDACKLPTEERPLRLAEFNDLFAFVVRAERPEPQRLNVVLRRIVEAPTRDLARRESECCSFFTFDFEPAGNEVVMHIAVPPEDVAVLDALEARIAAT